MKILLVNGSIIHVAGANQNNVTTGELECIRAQGSKRAVVLCVRLEAVAAYWYDNEIVDVKHVA